MFGGMSDNYYLSKNLYCVKLDHQRTNYEPPVQENDPLVFNQENSPNNTAEKQQEQLESDEELEGL